MTKTLLVSLCLSLCACLTDPTEVDEANPDLDRAVDVTALPGDMPEVTALPDPQVPEHIDEIDVQSVTSAPCESRLDRDCADLRFTEARN